MKNQNDLIFSIVAIVVFLIAFFVCYGTKPEPVKPPSPAAVNLAEPVYPAGVVPVMANELPGGGGGTSGGGAGRGGAPSMGGGAGRSNNPLAGTGKEKGLPQLSKGTGGG